MDATDNHLVELAFVHLDSRETLHVRIYQPRPDSDPQLSGGPPDWFTVFEVEHGGSIARKRAGGGGWLQSFLNAIEGARISLPEGDETRWATLDGLPSWMVLRRHVPIAWGYRFYRHVCSEIDLAEQTAQKGGFREQ